MDRRAQSMRIGAAAMVPLVVIVVLWLYPPLVSNGRHVKHIGEGTLVSGQNVEQTFVATSERIDGLGVIIATASVTDGAIVLTVGGTDDIVDTGEHLQASVGMSALSDWENHIFRLPNLRTEPGSTYRFTLSSAQPTHYYASKDESYEHGALTVDGRPLPQDLVFRVYQRISLSETSRLRGAGDIPGWFIALLLGGSVVSLASFVYYALESARPDPDAQSEELRMGAGPASA